MVILKIKLLPPNNFSIDVATTLVTRVVGILRSLKQSSAIKTLLGCTSFSLGKYKE